MCDGRPTPMRRAIVVLLALAFAAALPSTAGAVLSGVNGRIAFTSGRTMDDNHAQIFLRTTIGSSGGGAISDPLTPTSFQSRHASWSPDRTQLVLAGGTATGVLTTEHYDILIKDLTDGSISPLANSNTQTADHPAWSPDGTRIAYEEAPSAGSADRDIKVKLANSVATPPMTLSAD